MATAYSYAAANIQKTWLLIGAFFILLIGIFWLFSYAYNDQTILWFGVIFAVVMNVASYWFSDKIALGLSGAKPVAPKDNPELFRIVENLAITAGLPLHKAGTTNLITVQPIE